MSFCHFLQLAASSSGNDEFSGAIIHVCSPEDCPGYVLAGSPGSRSGLRFLMGDGGTIAYLGQKSLNLSDDGIDLRYVFQIAAPLQGST